MKTKNRQVDTYMVLYVSNPTELYTARFANLIAQCDMHQNIGHSRAVYITEQIHNALCYLHFPLCKIDKPPLVFPCA